MTNCYDHIGRDSRFRMFSVRYFPYRVQIKDLRHNKTRYLYRDDQFRDIQDQALNYLIGIGISVDGMGLANLDSNCVFLSKDIATPLK